MKRGLSGVVTAVILIALSVVAAMIVWGVVNNLARENLEGASSCFEALGKVNLNPGYTCYDSTDDNNVQFSISIGDISLDSVLILISGQGTTKSFEINQTPHPITNLKFLDGTTNVNLPGKNSGLTYVYTGDEFTTTPDSIEIAPIINNKQCETSARITDIDNCILF